jgi:hypothetical protein
MWFKGRENATMETERKSGCTLKFSGLHQIPLFRGGGKPGNPEKKPPTTRPEFFFFFCQDGAIENFTQKWTVSSDDYPRGPGAFTRTVSLPEVAEDARLYALVLEAHDKVQNVRYARRLVLVDNVSSVETTTHTKLSVVHANAK